MCADLTSTIICIHNAFATLGQRTKLRRALNVRIASRSKYVYANGQHPPTSPSRRRCHAPLPRSHDLAGLAPNGRGPEVALPRAPPVELAQLVHDEYGGREGNYKRQVGEGEALRLEHSLQGRPEDDEELACAATRYGPRQ